MITLVDPRLMRIYAQKEKIVNAGNKKIKKIIKMTAHSY